MLQHKHLKAQQFLRRLEKAGVSPFGPDVLRMRRRKQRRLFSARMLCTNFRNRLIKAHLLQKGLLK